MGSARSAPLILADTSAWVEYLRDTGSAAQLRLADLVASDDPGLVTTEIVVMEVLAGAPSDESTARLSALLARHPLVPLEGLADCEHAAAIFRACARAGRRVRGLDDCLIAAVAMRAGAALLHRDRDFDTIAGCTGLEIASA